MNAAPALALVEALATRGVELWPEDGELCYRGSRQVMTPEIKARLKEYKAVILRALEERDSLEHTLACTCLNCSAPSPRYAQPIQSEAEVFDMPREYFGMDPEEQEEPPIPPAEKGRDPFTHHHTDKARFFQGVRRSDQEKRSRGERPPWIRLADGGAS